MHCAQLQNVNRQLRIQVVTCWFFSCFDEENNGVIGEERLRELLTTMGDRFTDDDVDEMLREAPIRDGIFDYVEFTRILKHGAKDKDEQ